MQTDALVLAEQFEQAERLSWGSVELQVRDLEQSVAFWCATLGLTVREQQEHRVALGTDNETLFVFHAGALEPVSRSSLGMYHVAIGVPSQYEFSRLFARLQQLNVPVSPVDHLMSKAIYFNDPDGFEIEIAFETPERFDRFGELANGFVLYDINGNVHNGREALDVSTELSFAKGASLEAPISEDAFIAHIHFKVNELDASASWFEEVGFARNLMLPQLGFADMGAGAAYTHRLAMNTWAGSGLHHAPENTARLLRYTLRIHDAKVMAAIQGVRPSEFAMAGLDPSGSQVHIVASV